MKFLKLLTLFVFVIVTKVSAEIVFPPAGSGDIVAPRQPARAFNIRPVVVEGPEEYEGARPI
jgi:hypothetical protein